MSSTEETQCHSLRNLQGTMANGDRQDLCPSTSRIPIDATAGPAMAWSSSMASELDSRKRWTAKDAKTESFKGWLGMEDPQNAQDAQNPKNQPPPGQQLPQGPMLPGPPMTGAAMAPMAPMLNWPLPQGPMAMMPQMQMVPPPPPMSTYQQQAPPMDSGWVPSTSAPLGPPGHQPATMDSVIGQNFAMPAMPQMPAMPISDPAPGAVSPDLWMMLQQDVADLPPRIQSAVKESTIKNASKDGARATRDLHAAATHLGQKRKAYENAILAHSQLHSKWKRFLSDAVKLWQDFSIFPFCHPEVSFARSRRLNSYNTW